MTVDTYKGIMDSAMTVTGMAAAGCAMVVEILVSFALDSTGAIPAATVYTVRAATIGLIVSAAAFGALSALRLAIWLRCRARGSRRPRGVRCGVMSADEICAACRRMRT